MTSEAIFHLEEFNGVYSIYEGLPKVPWAWNQPYICILHILSYAIHSTVRLPCRLNFSFCSASMRAVAAGRQTSVTFADLSHTPFNVPIGIRDRVIENTTHLKLCSTFKYNSTLSTSRIHIWAEKIASYDTEGEMKQAKPNQARPNLVSGGATPSESQTSLQRPTTLNLMRKCDSESNLNSKSSMRRVPSESSMAHSVVTTKKEEARRRTRKKRVGILLKSIDTPESDPLVQQRRLQRYSKLDGGVKFGFVEIYEHPITM